MPWNCFCACHETYAADFEATLALCERRNVAVQTIKSIGRGAAGALRDRATWYQPLEDEDDIRATVRWVLARPRIFLNSVGDLRLLPLVSPDRRRARRRAGGGGDGASAGARRTVLDLRSLIALTLAPGRREPS